MLIRKFYSVVIIFAVASISASACRSYGAQSELSAADQSVLLTIHQAIANSTSPAKLDHVLPVNLTLWMKLQKIVSPYSEAASDLAFLVAYQGNSLEENVEIILLPYNWSRHEVTHTPSPTIQPKNSNLPKFQSYMHEAMADIPLKLSLLYQKTHKLFLLEKLLDCSFDSRVSADRLIELQHLWLVEAASMLRVSAGQPVRLSNLEDMFAFYNDVATPHEWSVMFSSLDMYSHNSDTQIATAAKSVRAYAATLPSPNSQ